MMYIATAAKGLLHERDGSAQDVISLNMSIHDATILQYILGRVTGNSDGPRDAQTRISRALRTMGFQVLGTPSVAAGKKREYDNVVLDGYISVKQKNGSCVHCGHEREYKPE